MNETFIPDLVDDDSVIVDDIRRGLLDMAAGRVVPHRDAMRRLRATVVRVREDREQRAR
jgi:predicted transcriptional regulator